MIEKDLKTIPAAGVVTEFYGPLGNVVAQEVFFDWPSAPVPEVGELLVCSSPGFAHMRGGKVVGRVLSRYYDVQRNEAGETQVWVRVAAEVCSSAGIGAQSPGSNRLSLN
jgi:hypothetical protein